MGRGDDLVTVSGLVLLVETEKALGLAVADELEGKKVDYWIPLSLVDARRGLSVFGEVGAIDVPRWWAEKQGLEYEE